MAPSQNNIAISRKISEFAECMISTRDAAAELRKRISTRTPTSFIRLGDGEAVLMSEFALREKMFDEYIVSHFGPGLSKESVRELSSLLNESVSGATMIGLREDMLTGVADPGWFALPDDAFLERFRETFSLRDPEREDICLDDSRRLVLLNLLMAGGIQFKNDVVLTSAWAHFDWAYSGFLTELIMEQSRIGLISCRRELPEIILKHGLAVDYYPVPSRFIRRQGGWTPHFPKRFKDLLKTLEVSYDGQVFLVGAGICGKVYCEEIRRRGGIGIDVGSACDAWLGLSTRPLVLRSKYGSDRVPVELTLDFQLHRLARGDHSER